MAHRTHLFPRRVVRPPALANRAAAQPTHAAAPAQAVVMLFLCEHPAMSGAIHAACQLARRQEALLALVVMVPVAHLGWLGSSIGHAALPASIERLQRQAVASAEDYGVVCALTRYQYTTWAEGAAQACELWGATTLIAVRPRRALPGWNAVEAWLLRRALARQGCEWREAPFSPPRSRRRT